MVGGQLERAVWSARTDSMMHSSAAGTQHQNVQMEPGTYCGARTAGARLLERLQQQRDAQQRCGRDTQTAQSRGARG